MTGASEILVRARSALLDALDALAEQRSALVLIGAQAIYLHTGAAPVALAESTKDSDISRREGSTWRTDSAARQGSNETGDWP